MAMAWHTKEVGQLTLGAPVSVDGEDEDAFRGDVRQVGRDPEYLVPPSVAARFPGNRQSQLTVHPILYQVWHSGQSRVGIVKSRERSVDRTQ